MSEATDQRENLRRIILICENLIKQDQMQLSEFCKELEKLESKTRDINIYWTMAQMRASLRANINKTRYTNLCKIVNKHDNKKIKYIRYSNKGKFSVNTKTGNLHTFLFNTFTTKTITDFNDRMLKTLVGKI
jgi:hypothetical protein